MAKALNWTTLCRAVAERGWIKATAEDSEFHGDLLRIGMSGLDRCSVCQTKEIWTHFSDSSAPEKPAKNAPLCVSGKRSFSWHPKFGRGSVQKTASVRILTRPASIEANKLKERKSSLYLLDMGGDVLANGDAHMLFAILSAVGDAERERVLVPLHSDYDALASDDFPAGSGNCPTKQTVKTSVQRY